MSFERGVSMHAEGSCLIKFGNTHVLCMASLEERIPPWLKGQGRGWVTAEYGMLPRATNERTRREATAGHPSGRTQDFGNHSVQCQCTETEHTATGEEFTAGQRSGAGQSEFGGVGCHGRNDSPGFGQDNAGDRVWLKELRIWKAGRQEGE